MVTNKKKGYFESIAVGEKGMPDIEKFPELSVFGDDARLVNFSNYHYSIRGNFDKHYWASIPYIYEQECRLGVAVLSYQKKYIKNRKMLMLSINTAESTLARTLAILSKGRIASLCTTPNKYNCPSFYAFNLPSCTKLIVCDYKELTNDMIEKNFPSFSCGFDFIIEDTNFQMENKNRVNQISKVINFLSEEGIIIFTEKCTGKDYDYWEMIKDNYFKPNFFSKSEIANKEKKLLDKMNPNLVSIDALINSCKTFFSYVAIIWNSGNFYSVISSNHETNFYNFIYGLPTACIPSRFCRFKEIVIIN